MSTLYWVVKWMMVNKKQGEIPHVWHLKIWQRRREMLFKGHLYCNCIQESALWDFNDHYKITKLLIEKHIFRNVLETFFTHEITSVLRNSAAVVHCVATASGMTYHTPSQWQWSRRRQWWGEWCHWGRTCPPAERGLSLPETWAKRNTEIFCPKEGQDVFFCYIRPYTAISCDPWQSMTFPYLTYIVKLNPLITGVQR